MVVEKRVNKQANCLVINSFHCDRTYIFYQSRIHLRLSELCNKHSPQVILHATSSATLNIIKIAIFLNILQLSINQHIASLQLLIQVHHKLLITHSPPLH